MKITFTIQLSTWGVIASRQNQSGVTIHFTSFHHPSPHPSLAQHPATSRSGCSYLKWKKLLTVFRTPFFWQGQLFDTEHVMLLISEWNKRVHKRTSKKGNLKLWLILHRAGGWPIQNEFVSFCRSTVDMTVAEPGLSPDPRHPCLCTGPGQPATKRRPPPGHIYPLYLPTCSQPRTTASSTRKKKCVKILYRNVMVFSILALVHVSRSEAFPFQLNIPETTLKPPHTHIIFYF